MTILICLVIKPNSDTVVKKICFRYLCRYAHAYVAYVWFTELPHAKAHKLKRLYKGSLNIWIIGGGWT